MTKKEGLLIQRQIDKLQARLSGVRDMKGLPDLLFIIDINREVAAVHEANLLNIPIVALVDTNCDPSPIDFVIPSNDDAIRAIKLLVGKVADAVMEGIAMRKDDQDERDAESQPSQASLKGKPSRKMELDEELSDSDLLGSATLAKLNVKESTEDEDETDEDSSLVEDETEEIVKPKTKKAEEISEEDESLEDDEEVEDKKKSKAKKNEKVEEPADDPMDDSEDE